MGLVPSRVEAAAVALDMQVCGREGGCDRDTGLYYAGYAWRAVPHRNR